MKGLHPIDILKQMVQYSYFVYVLCNIRLTSDFSPPPSVAAAAWAAATMAKYAITFFVFSVLPAPDSPLQRKATYSYYNVLNSSCNREFGHNVKR